VRSSELVFRVVDGVDDGRVGGCAGGSAWADRYPIAMWLGWGVAVLAESDGELVA
jgi:hypothetical protein